MQEEILQLYEKIKDQLSEEEFNAKIEELRETYGDVGFMNDIDLARMILENYGVEVPEVVSTAEDEIAQDDSIESDDVTEVSQESGFVMTEELQERYDKIKDQLTEEEFFARMEEFKKDNSHASFMSDTPSPVSLNCSQTANLEI